MKLAAIGFIAFVISFALWMLHTSLAYRRNSRASVKWDILLTVTATFYAITMVVGQ